MARDKSPRGAAKGRASSRQAKARSTASSRKKSSGKTYTFEVNLTTPDLAGAKKKIRGIGGAVVKTAKSARLDPTSKKFLEAPVSTVVRKAAGAVTSDVARGKERRATKMAATRTKADASAKLAQRKKQKATRSRIAARKRTGRGTGGG
mgnify:CR=1 FL=1|tara:strand:+ start:418 stop:864 length:447 start_codon:yes stop_codon:yes gene_type:complete